MKAKFIQDLLNTTTRDRKTQLKSILEHSGYEISDIYDVEKLSGMGGAFKANSVLHKYLFEAIDFTLDFPGGIIIFSTDLNATLESAETLFERIRFFFKSKWKTFLNRLNVTDRLKHILLDKYKQPGYTVGHAFRGSYKGRNGIVFNEKSYTVELAGIESDILQLIATEICREFGQETVMVRDFNGNNVQVYFVNQK